MNHSNPLSLWGGDPSRADQSTMMLFERVYGRHPASTVLFPISPYHRFNVNLFDGSLSTTSSAAQKRVCGQLYFDPSNVAWGLTPSSTATLYVMLSTTNAGNAAGADLYRETGTGSPTTVATLPTTTSLTQALLSVSVSSAFNSTSNAGIFDMRFWITTNNGNDTATCTAAWVEITP